MNSICQWIVRIYLALWAAALAILLIGWFGLFDQPRDPLAGVFLVPLGLPWAFWTGGLPEGIRPVAAILAPLLNVVLLAFACRAARRRAAG